MLPKKRRIQRTEFQYILSNGKRFVSPHLLLYITPLEKQALPSRFSFSVSKKICKHAVERNKYRRQGYSIISAHLDDIMNGHYFFFVFKKGTYPVSFNLLSTEIFSLLKEAYMLI